MKTVVGIYVYEQAEVLDFSGPFETFSTATWVQDEPQRDDGFEVYLIGETMSLVKARNNFGVQPHYSIDNHPDLHVLVVPGGVHEGEMQKPSVTKWLAAQYEKIVASHPKNIVASVCTGAFLLAQAGIFDRHSSATTTTTTTTTTAPPMVVTTHWDDIADLRRRFPALTVVERERWVDQGQIVTSAGISAGIDMALHLVARLRSRDVAERTAKMMEFDWTQTKTSQQPPQPTTAEEEGR